MNLTLNHVTYRVRQHELLTEATRLNRPTQGRPLSPLQELVRKLRRLLPPQPSPLGRSLTLAN